MKEGAPKAPFFFLGLRWTRQEFPFRLGWFEPALDFGNSGGYSPRNAPPCGFAFPPTRSRLRRSLPAIRIRVKSAFVCGDSGQASDYSVRTMTGSMRVARRAGRAEAASATTASRLATVPTTRGSAALTPKS